MLGQDWRFTIKWPLTLLDGWDGGGRDVFLDCERTHVTPWALAHLLWVVKVVQYVKCSIFQAAYFALDFFSL